MSQPVSRFLHSLDATHHPTLEPEVMRAILASLATDRNSGVEKAGSQDRAVKGRRSFDGRGRVGGSRKLQ